MNISIYGFVLTNLSSVNTHFILCYLLLWIAGFLYDYGSRNPTCFNPLYTVLFNFGNVRMERFVMTIEDGSHVLGKIHIGMQKMWFH